MASISLREMQSHQYGINDKAKCHICGLILEAAEFRKPGLITSQIGTDSDNALADVWINIEIDSQLNVQKVAPSKFRRGPWEPRHYENSSESSASTPLPSKTMWGEMCQNWDIVEDSTTQAAFDRAARWLSHCMKYDEPCRPPDAHFTPRRLLNVGQEGGPFLVKPTEPTEYACLSYCWGETAESVLRTTNVQDAVKVCRGLNIPYLWVDSLCIIQDDAEAWHHDASMMDHIYLNSQLTIAALEPSSCKTGFLGKQRFGFPGWQHQVKLQDTSRKVIVRPEPDIVEYSLDKRGWCLQETMLSQRRLCFDGNEMSWECLCRKVCECGHYIWSLKEPGRNDISLVQIGALLKEDVLLSAPLPRKPISSLMATSRYLEWLMGTRSPNLVGTAPDRIYELWRTAVSSYSKRLLSRQSDKLMALAGLARVIIRSREGNYGENEYLAGLWKIELPFELAWMAIDSKPRPHPLVDGESAAANQKHFPSWSWASCDGVVGYDCTLPLTSWKSGPRYKFRVIDECSLAGVMGISTDGTPTSEGGRIRLKGGLMPVELAIFEEDTPEGDRPGSPTFLSFLSDMSRTGKTSAFVRPRNLHSTRVYLDELVGPTMRRDDAQVSCWLQGGRCTHCCEWNQKTEYYCFRLFSWILPTGKGLITKTGIQREILGPQVWFLVLKLSGRAEGAFERIGVGVGKDWRDTTKLFEMEFIDTSCATRPCKYGQEGSCGFFF
ncbi:HET-domain-containing protein [Hypoxylon rubiginosum]|uniref:HET-domain-containing protein n=1 Tax=Hypoxylon rubiginosum TaxID=110542 RepID=A0ACB9YRL3_9PEZI|nr:HET-domain-containing protein [Hypoxylon rubiginosum]